MTEKHPQNDEQRLYYMDNLRALAMFLGILLHSALAYTKVLHHYWVTANPQKTAWLDQLFIFIHSFRMPLFFIIAGFFSMLMLRNKGYLPFLRNRLSRIGLPLLLLGPPILICLFSIVYVAFYVIETYPPIFTHYINAIASPETPKQLPISLGHFWFLFNLMGFCIFLLLIHKTKCYQSKWVTTLFKTPYFSIFLLPVLLLPSTLTFPLPIILPADQLAVQPWSYGLYGLFFVYGYLLNQHTVVLDQIDKLRYPLLILSIVIYGYWCSQLMYYGGAIDHSESPISIVSDGHPITANFVRDIWCMNFIAVNFSLLALVFGRRLLNSQNCLMRYLSDASYWMYLVHLPIVFVVQYVLIDRPWPANLEFSITLVVTCALCLLSYQYWVRGRFLGRLLNGK